MEQQWLEIFKLLPTAKGIPANVDTVIKDVYERLLVGRSSKRFIAKVAKDMVDRKEHRACLSTARRKGLEEGRIKGLEEGRLEGREEGINEERAKNEATNAARDSRIADYLRSIGVSAENVSAALSIR